MGQHQLQNRDPTFADGRCEVLTGFVQLLVVRGVVEAPEPVLQQRIEFTDSVPQIPQPIDQQRDIDGNPNRSRYDRGEEPTSEYQTQTPQRVQVEESEQLRCDRGREVVHAAQKGLRSAIGHSDELLFRVWSPIEGVFHGQALRILFTRNSE
jgi:hypothetical protein